MYRLVIGVLIVLALALTAFCIDLGRPVEMVDAPGGRVQCVSYAPSSRRDETLVDVGVIVPPERIERDLKLLAARFDCVRTYSQSNGLAEVPRLARPLGLEVMMGVWLGRDPEMNEREIESALRVAARDRDVLRAIVVGNEVLLRGEMPPTALRAYIERIRRESGVPTTYADVWEFWSRYGEVISSAVDFVTIHILPYWEDNPVAVTDAVPHIAAIYRQMQAEFPEHELLIGETGWPSAGRQRQGAVPGTVNQARFIRQFLAYTRDAGIRYNVIEAFDQPWKRRQEGAVGGYWGLYDHERNEKFSLVGPVVEDPRWYVPLAVGIIAAILFAAAMLRERSRRGMLLMVLAGYATGVVVTFQSHTAYLASRNPTEWIIAIVWTALAAATSWFIARVLTLSSHDSASQPGSDVLVWLRSLRFVWLCSAALVSLLLVLDSRYRDFPLALFSLPIGGYVLLWFALRLRLGMGVEERLLATWLVIAAFLGLAVEGLLNVHAWGWTLLGLVFGLVVLLGERERHKVLERRPAAPGLSASQQ